MQRANTAEEAVFEAFAQPIGKMFKLLPALLELLFFTISVPFEMLFRYRFGLRYLSLPILILAVISIPISLTLTFIAHSIDVGTMEGWSHVGGNLAILLWTPGAIGLAVVHRVTASLTTGPGKRPWHSCCRGLSWPIWQRIGLSADATQRLLEPGLVVTAGVVLYMPAPSLAMYLLAAGVAFFLKEQLAYVRSRDRILDVMDRQIEQENMMAALDIKRDARQTGGFVVPLPAFGSASSRARCAEDLAKLDPKLQPTPDSSRAAVTIPAPVGVPPLNTAGSDQHSTPG